MVGRRRDSVSAWPGFFDPAHCGAGRGALPFGSVLSADVWIGIAVEGLRSLGLSVIVVLGALVLGLVVPGKAVAMSDHSGHASMSHATADSAAPHTDATHIGVHGADAARAQGGCAKGLMADCCVMTCCSATEPEISGDAVRHLVIAARSSRPTVADGRAIVPLLEPPKRVS